MCKLSGFRVQGLGGLEGLGFRGLRVSVLGGSGFRGAEFGCKLEGFRV